MVTPENRQIEQWGIFECALNGPESGNPFIDIEFSAEFINGSRIIQPEGFYDGNGMYRIRCMPDRVGTWTFTTRSNSPELDNKHGTFECVAPRDGNHGPVRVHDTFHFACEDGTPHFSFGTTCYAWIHQGDGLARQTLETLKTVPFNKMRMMLTPKNFTFNKNEPVYHMFEGGSPKQGGNTTRFNPEYFRNIENRIADLREQGIEADLILFTSYDFGRWDYDKMDPRTDERYIRYLVARCAAFRNVWWSLANEYDLMADKTMEDWDRYFKIIQKYDPYGHLRSVHNAGKFYDHTKPWVTHCSIQSHNPAQCKEWRTRYGKPVVDDECCYEGNIEPIWGNITAQELVHRFWMGVCSGGYVGHGETYYHPDDILWWSKGGTLHGESPSRIAFLRNLLEQGPGRGINPVDLGWNSIACAGIPPEYYLHYFGVHQPTRRVLDLPPGNRYKIDLIDTWEMTITPLDGIFEGSCEVSLPQKPCQAIQVRRI